MKGVCFCSPFFGVGGAYLRSEGDCVPVLLNKLQSATAVCPGVPFFLALFCNYSLGTLCAVSEGVASSAASECVFSVVSAGRVQRKNKEGAFCISAATPQPRHFCSF